MSYKIKKFTKRKIYDTILSGEFRMKRFTVLILLFVFIVTMFVSACTKMQKTPLIQSRRRFAEYMEPQKSSIPGAVDLSEGPRQKYEANFGPQNLNFDIRIVDPY